MRTYITSFALVLVPVFVVIGAACSSSGGTTGTITVACRQKAGADTDDDCNGHAGKPRKLDCDSADESAAAINVGCEAQKPGDEDVCCPTSVSGQGATSAGHLACRQKSGADTDKDCAGRTGFLRKLDCDSDSDTNAAVAAGCQLEKDGSNDVCCPTTVSGTPEDTTSSTSSSSTSSGSTTSSTSSSSSSSSSSGSSGSTTTAQATVDVQAGGPTGCAGQVFTLGTFSPSKAVANGEAGATVTCSVKDQGGGTFAVNVFASQNGGSVNASGTITSTLSDDTLNGVLTSTAGASLTRNDCVVTFPAGGGIAAGRIWGTMNCAGKGATAPDACTATAQFRFENCGQ